MNRLEHWQQVYNSKPPNRLGWYKPRLETSLEWIQGLELPRDAPIIDIGCGASTLVDDLLDREFQAITALDISEQALDVVRERLGDKASGVECLLRNIECRDRLESLVQQVVDERRCTTADIDDGRVAR